MTTPAGWVRANILYDSLSKPPKPGSPLESVCAFVFTMRQSQEFQKTRAFLQGLLRSENEDAVKKVLKDFQASMFPHEGIMQWDSKPLMQEILTRELSKGPLVVSPIKPQVIPHTQKTIKLSKKELRKY